MPLLFAGCPSSSSQGDDAPTVEAGVEASELAACSEALAELSKDIDSLPLDALPARLEGLCEGPTQLLSYYARAERGEWDIDFDPASDQAVKAACPDWDKAQKEFSKAYPWKLGERMWRRCKPIADYGVVEDASELGYHPTIIPWALHAWLLGEGIEAAQASAITRRVVALDRRTNVFTVAGVTPPAGLPQVKGADWLEFGPGTIVRVNDRSVHVPGKDLEAPLLGGKYLAEDLEGRRASLKSNTPTVQVSPVVTGNLSGNCERGWVAVDPSLPYETFFYTVSSAAAVCEVVEVIVELGEPGDWRIGAFPAEIADDQDAPLPDGLGVEVKSRDRRVLLRTAPERDTGEALGRLGTHCAMGSCFIEFALSE